MWGRWLQYKCTRNSNTVIRGGVGIFYDPLPGVPGTAIANNAPFFNFFSVSGYNLAPSESNSLSQNTSASNAAFLTANAAQG